MVFDELQVAPLAKVFISFIPVFLVSDPETLKEIFGSGNTFSDHPYVLTKLLRIEKGLITSTCKFFNFFQVHQYLLKISNIF